MFVVKEQCTRMCTQNLRNIKMACHKIESLVRNWSGEPYRFVHCTCNRDNSTPYSMLFCGRVGCLTVQSGTFVALPSYNGIKQGYTHANGNSCLEFKFRNYCVKRLTLGCINVRIVPREVPLQFTQQDQPMH
jgi:hypothetical protein